MAGRQAVKITPQGSDFSGYHADFHERFPGIFNRCQDRGSVKTCELTVLLFGPPHGFLRTQSYDTAITVQSSPEAIDGYQIASIDVYVTSAYQQNMAL
jgi:hypothetical protein